MNSQLDDAFGALANPVRRGIVERLAQGPATVAVATGGLGVSKPAISRHLRVLEDAGLVRREVRGRTHRLSLADGTLADALAWLARQEAMWQRKFDVIDAYLEERR
ncbi:MAG TPA: metalloregulator ArsR/SmtB family transcription factor [Miltoncostaeaceae bacterium]|nr:metalloregulator ArsR/SmtB family transcription factor [Miltoncostaeaceae bacterium]